MGRTLMKAGECLVSRKGSLISMQQANNPVVRPATQIDRAAIWSIIEPTIREGRTYALDPSMSEKMALSYWYSPGNRICVAERNGQIVGTYYLRANQGGGGRHVANCGYMTLASAQGSGVARTMCLHSLRYARDEGFQAIQFNFVVSSNVRAVKLWKSLGFVTVGRLPNAFRLPTNEYVDAIVMHRNLEL